MNYDRPEFHLDGRFPRDLPQEAASTHIGMFLAWAVVHDLVGDDLREHAADMLDKVRSRQMTGREFFLEACDFRLTSGDFNDEGNRFAVAYYRSGLYLADYRRVLGSDVETMYHVADTWANFDRIAEAMDRRHADPKTWVPRPWWKFW